MEGDYYQCKRCGKASDKTKICMVDEEAICVSCMYADKKPFEIYPIGVVKNRLERGEDGFGAVGKEGVSCIELLPSQKPFMFKLEEEEFLTVVYYLHRAKPVKSKFNRGLDNKKVGVFASRTPDRLSKIAIQDVRLIKIEGAALFVEGLDAIDGSPVLDIKLKV